MATPFDINTTLDTYLQAYSGQPTSPESLAEVPAQVNLANAPNLENLSTLVNQINQRAQQAANLSRTGGAPEYDQAILQNIYNMTQGYVSPETVREAESAAAQQWGGAGFGVDTPAMQSAVRRTLGLTREEQQAKGAEEYARYLAAHPSAPIYDIRESLVSPELYEKYTAGRRQQELELASMAAKLAEARGQAYASIYGKLLDPALMGRYSVPGEIDVTGATAGGYKTNVRGGGSAGIQEAASRIEREALGGYNPAAFGWGAGTGGYVPSLTA